MVEMVYFYPITIRKGRFCFEEIIIDIYSNLFLFHPLSESMEKFYIKIEIYF
jgi:hypothetical protein